MPNIFCPNPPNDCNDPSVPSVNYSSETPDFRAFFGRSYNVQEKPPLGSPWESTGCIGTCVSEISQADADACAQRQLITCLGNEWPVYEDNPNDDPEQPPVLRQPRTTYVNEEKIGTFTCPDGEVFTYTVPAGTVAAFSQAAADSFAQSMADNGAIDFRICIGDLSNTGACSDEAFEATAQVSAPSLNQPGFEMVATVASGVLPPGMQLDYGQNSFTISGETNSPGQYDFTIQVDVLEDGFVGNFMQKSFTIYVREVSPDTMAEGTEGNNYSEQLVLTGAVGTVTWAITSGALPDGLTLDEATGAISGVPETEDVFTFTATGTDSLGSCSKELSIDVGPGVPFDELVWTQITLEEVGSGSASFSPPNGGTGNEFDAATSLTAPAPNPSRGRTSFDADLVYAGPNRACRVTMQIVNNDLFADPGLNSLTCSYFLNAVLQNNVTMAQAFNGELQLNFTAQAGAIKIRFDMFSSQSSGTPALAITCSGVIENL